MPFFLYEGQGTPVMFFTELLLINTLLLGTSRDSLHLSTLSPYFQATAPNCPRETSRRFCRWGGSSASFLVSIVCTQFKSHSTASVLSYPVFLYLFFVAEREQASCSVKLPF